MSHAALQLHDLQQKLRLEMNIIIIVMFLPSGDSQVFLVVDRVLLNADPELAFPS